MPKRHVAPLVAGAVRLRLLQVADLPVTLAWRNEDHVRKWFLHSEIITSAQHTTWWEHYKDRDDDFMFVIEETEKLKRAVGQVGLYNIDWASGRAEFGRLLIGDAEARGLGFARMATSRLIDEGINAWNLKEIHLEVLLTNDRAIAVYRACGFREVDRRLGTVLMQIETAQRNCLMKPAE